MIFVIVGVEHAGSVDECTVEYLGEGIAVVESEDGILLQVC